MTTSTSRPATESGEQAASSRGTRQPKTPRVFQVSVLLFGGVAMMATFAIAWSSATPPMTTGADQPERAVMAPGSSSETGGEPQATAAAVRAELAPPAELPAPPDLRADEPPASALLADDRILDPPELPAPELPVVSQETQPPAEQPPLSSSP